MFLKAIEMQGFKSFADKTKISFEPGVTAVVGPNGSGKSNITESLRWALGESSAKSLRGGKMPDVIFAGTENRHALNYAQVTVVLDNSDAFIAHAASEIRVERHVYRNGDSDYLIDGKKVRLRDIHDLFMDTGLGRDSFSIISQGRVEAIFNSKPEERRAIFEEAAGVLKYKTRKKETEQKLGQTQDNLDRLEDIIYELELQEQPLRQQAEVAQTFLRLDGDRQQLQLNLLVADVQQVNQALADNQYQLAQVKKELTGYYQQRDELETSNQVLKEKRQSLQGKQESLQKDLLENTRLLADLRRQMDLAKLASSQKSEQKLSVQKQQADLQEQKIKLTGLIADKVEKLEQINQDLDQVRHHLQALEKELIQYSSTPDQMMEELREQFLELMQTEADLSNELTALQATLSSQEEQSRQKSVALEQLQVEHDQVTRDYQMAAESLAESRSQLDQLLATYQSLQKSLAEKESTYRQKQTALFDLMDEMKTKKARHQSLTGILKNHSHFYAGVKFILQQAADIGGIVGAVSEHVSFDLTYRTAMEVALGASSQHIIVADEGAAKRSIDLLKKNRQGRATFLPLTTIKPRQIPPHQLAILQKSPGFLGVANDLVTYDQSVSVIFGYLLGAIAVFENLDQANQAARHLGYQLRLVTLDGSDLRPGGSFAGGANRQNNMTFIKPELEELTKELSRQEQAIQVAESDLGKDQAELAGLTNHLAEIKEEGEQARLVEQKSRLEHEQLEQRLADLTSLLARNQGDHQEEIRADLIQRQRVLEGRLLDVEEAKSRLTQELNQIKDNKDHVQERLAALREQVQETKLRERDLVSANRFERANLNQLEEDVKQLSHQLTKIDQQLQTYAQEDNPKYLAQIQEELVRLEGLKNQQEQANIRQKLELEDCDAALEEVAERLLRSGQKNEELIRAQTQLELAIDGQTNQLRQFAHQLAEDYQMSFDEAKEAAQVLSDFQLARQQLKALVKEIKVLGSVNLEAIQQHQEVKQRLTFLTNQKEDLVEAKRLLTTTIDEMNNDVKERFKASFEAIRQSFKHTFKQMFGGGSSDLILTEQDLLTAGIEISVQPPGKKIQSLNLMSGGEKALSALALLFAIIRVKTIPFVILDEVEAALDEANVKRFGDYLNRFDKSSQFIVVTHRKGTMAAADSIYGVTMQESGVSKIVSVKLAEAEKLMTK
ncbi:chromosome segregation protein SMC [Streptococcus cuniculipharyngis]|uniref:Chromosome partition protein Smc n=1 Tax=Streptococcus cuniculipharyngis TaxID=1562651 RepID=A0A5C5SEH1_9STRE|nr:chromosome segregation protein SMC [Streptococcus cuniculipharyngis]TWS98690.1 chromosome segregation protein SMC [Streptococcus cuniculipharyngis]